MAEYEYSLNDEGEIVSGTPDISEFIIDDNAGSNIIIRFLQEGDLFQNTIINVNGFDIAISDGNFIGDSDDYHFDDTIPNFAEIYASMNTGPGGGPSDFISFDPSITEFAYEEYTKKSDGSWVLVNQGSGESGGDVSTGLEAIDEGNGIGWRLIGKNPDNFGDIGEGAVDLSQGNDNDQGATGYISFSAGYNTTASGRYSAAFGYYTSASGSYSTAFGYRTEASGRYSIATGYKTDASGRYSTAMGNKTTASGIYSTAMGRSTTASGNYSTAMGYETIASGNYSTAVGKYATASGDGSFAGGSATESDKIKANNTSFAFGMAAEKYYSGSGSGGGGGYYTTGTILAYGTGSVAMGYSKTSLISSGTGSIALGYEPTASNKGSVALGYRTRATQIGQVALGKNNRAYDINTILEVGIGTYYSRRNAFEVFLDGTATLPDATIAEITNRGNKALVTKEYVDGLGGELVKDGLGYRIKGQSAGTLGSNAVNLGESTSSTGDYSLVSGYGTIGSGNYSVALGNSNRADGWASISLGDGNTVNGDKAFAVGANGNSEGYTSIAMGFNSQALENYSVGIGYGARSYAEGGFALGKYATVEAGATNSMAFGYFTAAKESYQTVFGKYNSDQPGTTLIVGIGNSSVKMNAFEIYDDGRIIAPRLTTNFINNGGNRSLVTKEYADALGGGGSGELIKDSDGYRISGQSTGYIGTGGVNLQKGTSTVQSYSLAAGFYNTINGSYSTALGSNNFVTGDTSTAMGYANSANGTYSTVFGSSNSAGYISVAGGKSNKATGDFSVALGFYADAQANYSVALGKETIAKNSGSISIGVNNVGTATNTILEVGIGPINTDRKNGLEVYTTGVVKAPELTTALIAGELTTSKVLITKEYGDANYAGGSSGELIKDGLGYRISGQSTGTLGSSAVNLSQSGTATQYHSFSAGYHTNATGGYSSIAMGRMSTASSKGSIAIGYGCTSSGYFTTAMGRLITANSYATSAIGFDLESPGTMGGMAVGTRNARKADTSFEVGIGTGDLDHKNGFEVYFDGKVKAPELTTALIDAEATGKVLVTKEYLLSAEFGLSLPTVDPAVPGTPWNNAGVLSISV